MKIFFVIGIFLVTTNFCYSQTDGEWVTVTIFHGTSNENTDDFPIRSNKWRVVWEATYQNDEYKAGNFIVNVVNEKGNEDLIVNAMPIDNGKTIMRKTGVFSFAVKSFNCKWKIEVQEYRAIKK